MTPSNRSLPSKRPPAAERSRRRGRHRSKPVQEIVEKEEKGGKADRPLFSRVPLRGRGKEGEID